MVYKIFLVARAASCYTRENALPLAACHLTFRKIEFRTRTRMMRWDLLIPANTNFEAKSTRRFRWHYQWRVTSS
jgi:hypothetical protein